MCFHASVAFHGLTQATLKEAKSLANKKVWFSAIKRSDIFEIEYWQSAISLKFIRTPNNSAKHSLY